MEELDNLRSTRREAHALRDGLDVYLRECRASRLANIQGMNDRAVRAAFDAGASVADIMRAYGTKDRHTILNSLKRTALAG
ncbi:hypothetical protein CN1A_3 [Clavibacter phage CN1A]|uniref:Uncharacterized protein n=1 Tax=Clavibacter phage CN1A TaxID=1406793 RepID=U5PX09_9CAUD|nr:hypothetical protein CN1A_3 [Clavibacter phage CN1A]AGY47112.1 hypothetical protein CN1A_3 [Clavibacter phage CN1A]